MSGAIAIRQTFVREAFPTWKVAPHRHAVTQWYHCLSGGMTVGIDGRLFGLQAGDSVLVPPNATRECWRSGNPPRYIVAIFSEQRLDLRQAHSTLLTLPSTLAGTCESLVREISVIGDVESPLLIEALLVRLLIALLRSTRSGGAVSTDLGQLVADVDVVMQRNLHLRLTRADVAQAVQFSEVHLARRFKAATGKTLHERLTELRMQQARALLTTSTMSVSQIADQVGFGSISHFTKAFKAHAGMTPSAYREAGVQLESE